MGGLYFLKGREEKVDRRERGGWLEVLGGEEEGRGNWSGWENELTD